MMIDRKGKEYHIGKETFRVYSVDDKLIIERLWGEWIHDFTPSYTEKFFLHMITIEKELIPVLIKLFRILEKEFLEGKSEEEGKEDVCPFHKDCPHFKRLKEMFGKNIICYESYPLCAEYKLRTMRWAVKRERRDSSND